MGSPKASARSRPALLAQSVDMRLTHATDELIYLIMGEKSEEATERRRVRDLGR
jgi:hypothetical protein